MLIFVGVFDKPGNTLKSTSRKQVVNHCRRVSNFQKKKTVCLENNKYLVLGCNTLGTPALRLVVHIDLRTYKNLGQHDDE